MSMPIKDDAPVLQGSSSDELVRRIGVATAAIVCWATVLDRDSLVWVSSALFVLLLLQAVLFKKLRVPSLVFASLLLYASCAWVVFLQTGENYPPWPSPTVIVDTTVQDLGAVLLALAAVEICWGFEKFDRAVRSATLLLREQLRSAENGIFDHTLSIAVVSVSLLDWGRVASLGLSSVLQSSRREYAGELNISSSHNYLVVAIACSVYLIGRAVLSDRRLLPGIAVFLLWAPAVLVGSRKEVIILSAICVLLFADYISRFMWSILASGGVALLLLPFFQTEDITRSLHEFVLPQYTHFAVMQGLVPDNLGGSFASKAQLLLPSPLRWTDVTDFGQAFKALSVTGVGLGGSPFTEADISVGPGLGPYFMVATIVVIFSLVIVASRTAPTLAVVAVGLLFVYGRSDFWTYLFFAIYVSGLIHCVVASARTAGVFELTRFGKSAAPHRRTSAKRRARTSQA